MILFTYAASPCLLIPLSANISLMFRSICGFGEVSFSFFLSLLMREARDEGAVRP